MKNDLKLEVFASKSQITPVQFHGYKLQSKNMDDSIFKIVRGACWTVRNRNRCGVFENGKFIYTTEKINTEIADVDFELEYIGLQWLDVQENKRVYEELIKYYIGKKLERVLVLDKYRKYICKGDITSKWILTNGGPRGFSSRDKKISLERKYNIWVEIGEDNIAYLRIDTSSNFVSNLTIMDYLEDGIDVMGMTVKNDWSKNKQTGTVVEVCDYTVSDTVDIRTSLKDYYIQKGEEYRVEKLPDDSPVVRVQLKGNQPYSYYPQALKPVLTREMVGKLDPKFSLEIEQYVKRDMKLRLELDQDFINDIGEIVELDNLAFETECCDVERLGFSIDCVNLPRLTCADDKNVECGNEYKVFNYGFYKCPSRQLKIGYLYPAGTEELMKAVANAIYYFAVKGIYHGVKDQYIREGLLGIQVKPMIREEYVLGNLTEYKRAANKIKKVEGLDMVITIVPDGTDEDNPYNPFKSIWAEENIPSQMVSMSTAKLFATETDGQKTKYFLHNIVLGILGKTGGIPWIIKDMPGNVDCFVGLDVATVESGIHFPACSVVFDKFGRILGYYKPKQVQKGEKIATKILQDIFDQVILSYEDAFGESPKNIVIHRDGFSNENDEWYKNYFAARDINYTIVEVRKNISSKLIYYKDGEVTNPEIGHCVYNDNKAYLVTTGLGRKSGSPNPILLEKKCGDADMKQLIQQILNLSQLHVGSTHKTRLPITTGYADKICKNREFVPEGKVDNKLFFL